jgi:metallo-beta-lactamase family protein
LALTQIILQDSARLQAADAMRKNKKAWRRAEPMVEPLYNTEHVEYMDELAVPVSFNTPVKITDDVTARWIEAGHMLGSGSIEITVTEESKVKTIIFSGDLGPLTLPYLRPYEHFSKADLVIMESTYGDRCHKPYDQTLKEFESIVHQAYTSKAKMLVPTFAIGRAQQIVYHLAEMFHSRRVPAFPVYLDSPMALSAFNVYKTHQDLLDDEYLELKRKGVFPINTDYFIPSQTAKASKALNDVNGPCMILAGAGMCNGGRILHHLFHNLENQNTHVLIVGYQSYGSIGRRLVEKAPKISIFGDEKIVRAQVHTLGGFSAHAGQDDLLNWFSYLAPSNPKVVITHGEDGPRQALADCLKKQFKIDSTLPKIGETIEL